MKPSLPMDSTPLRQTLTELIQLQFHCDSAFRHDLMWPAVQPCTV